MPFTAQPQEKCVACGRTVFLTERTIVEEKEEKRTYHKSCIRCTTCDKVLSLGNYASSNGAFYCKPHFKQLFATKGNYDEGFGAEKINSKWDPQAVIAPSSFIPEVKEERKTERKETSEATQEKFKKFREEGESNRCTFCDKTVYLAEKLLVEDKDGKRLFHKACFKCVTCDIILDLRNYGAEKGKIYCKNHLKEVQAANLKTSYVAAPTSFVPEVKEEKKSEKKETSVETQEKFKKFREEGEANKCSFCDKTVYLAEKLLVEDRDGKRLFHKACFKCVTCDIILDLRNYGSDKGKTYCKNHLKEVQAANLKSSYVPPPTSFVPDTQEEKKTEKTATPDHIAAKFKEAPSEKCRACGKSVYLAEKLIVPELKQQHIYHKNCLRCTKCDVKLDLSTYGSDSGRIFCKVHLKEAALPEPAKMKPDDPYNLLPMYNAKKEPSQQSQENQDTSSYYDDDDNTSSVSSTTPAQSSTPVQSSPVQSRSNRNSYRSSGQFTETKPAEPSPQPSPKVQRAAEPEPVRQTEQESEDPEEIRRRERQRAKEERQRKIDEELQREEEERERRKAERERRLASYSDDIDGSSASTSSPSDENEERKKRREQRERERKEQEEREQEERAQKEKEREERRKKREQEAAAEEAERQKKLEEKRRQRNDEQQS